MNLDIIILAAGQGTRMRSKLPKVLHKIGGLTLLEHVIKTAQSLNPDQIFVVYGHGGEQIQQTLKNASVTWIKQNEQLGTGHAVAQVIPHLQNPDNSLLILYGDVPLISHNTLRTFITQTNPEHLGLLTTMINNPTGFGRIIRGDKQQVTAIIEEKDADTEQRLIKEINTGIYYTAAKNLVRWLPQINTQNSAKEYYLTDIVKLAAADKIVISTTATATVEEVQGINDRLQLSQLERYYQQRLANEFLLSGVTIKDPHRFDVRGNAEISADVTIDINVILDGNVIIDSDCYIGAHSILRNVKLGKGVFIHPNCVIDDAIIGENCTIGPFARIRPGTELANSVEIGNFAEIKNSKINSKSKMHHFSYVGDTNMGERVNVGAGTITCNYDGANKHRTIIGNDVFIGSDSQLVAPVTLGDGATIGAGSTITKDAPAQQLTLSRSQQKSIPGWQRPVKKKD